MEIKLGSCWIILFLTTLPLFGQNKLEGRIANENQEAIPFANIALFAPQDTTKLLAHAMSDMNGVFSMEKLSADHYLLRVSCIGYHPYSEAIHLKREQPPLNIGLTPQVSQLQEVQIKGSGVKTTAEKVAYTVTQEDIKGKRYALDLIDKVPKLSVDPVEQRIRRSDGKEVKILINGMSASESDLKMLRPEKVIRLEHYDIPPARYAEYGSVMNVVTRSAEQGWAAGLDLAHAFTTGFGNDMAYLKFNSGHSQWSLDYTLHYRDYSRREEHYRESYTFDQVFYEREESSRNAFGYDDHQINLTYSCQIPDKGSVQVRFSPNYMGMHNQGTSQIRLGENQLYSGRVGMQHRNSHVFNPVLDLYAQRTLFGGGELLFNIVGTAFQTGNKYLNTETDDSQEVLLKDFMDETNRKYSFISELVYVRPMGPGKLNVGYQNQTTNMRSEVDNTFEASAYTTRYQQHYAYTQWQGKRGKWMLNAQCGLSYRNSQSYSESYDAWIFRPLLMVGYEWNERQNLRWVLKRENNEPGLAEWSNNKVYETDHIIRQGNPKLRHSVDNETYLDYTCRWGKFTLELIPYFCFTQHPISSYYSLQPESIVLASENGHYQRKYGMQYVLQFRPFDSPILQLQAEGQYMKTELSSPIIGNYAHWNYPFSYRIVSQWKDLTLYFLGNVVGKSLDGPFLVSDENAMHLGLQYAKGAWGFSAMCYWLGTESKYSMHTIDPSLVMKDRSFLIHDNASMLVFGISYAWQKGKAYSKAEKQLHHRDGDAGMFR